MAANSGRLVKGLKLVTAYTSGVFAGGSTFIAAVDHPARLSMIRGLPEGHKSATHHFKFMHEHVEKMQIPLVATAFIGSAAVFFLSKGAPKRKFWLAGTGVLACVFPLSGGYINPRYRHPICNEPDKVAAQGPEHVEQLFHEWSFGHRTRATASCIAFLIFLGALL